MSPRLINALFTVAAIVTPLVGCATAIFDYRWYRAAPPLEPVWVQVSTERLSALCDGERFLGLACVRRRYDLGICLIFATVPREEVPDFIVHHEEQKHCREGLNHE